MIGAAEQSHTLLSASTATSELLALLDKISDETSWYADAACNGKDPTGEIFFPPNGQSTAEAKAICVSCPVFDECHEASGEELYGVWAGKSVEERRNARMRRQRRRGR